jgi:3',5'-nucleoside bisphosphate phosphatase
MGVRVKVQGVTSLRRFRAELHVHTVLSPCAEVEMIPPLIIREAMERGVSLLAITDHNATANILAVQEAARDSGVIVLPGMEVQTREEVHVLCLFDTLEQVSAWQRLVSSALPEVQNRPDFFGEQFVVDSTGDFIRREEQLLITSTSFSIEEAFHQVHRLGGLFIPAHVDRKAFGIIANLGFIPLDIPFEAVEISRHLQPEEAMKRFPQLSMFHMIRSGDVHRLEEFIGANLFELAEPTISEIRLALRGEANRSHVLIEAS